MQKESGRTLTLGVDIGGTKIESVLVDGKGNIIGSSRRPTNAGSGAKGVVNEIIQSIKDSLELGEEGVVAVGVGIAGQVEGGTGIIKGSPNLPLTGISLKNLLEEEFDLPVYVTNDVRAATWGEWVFGAGRGSNDIILMFVGTGIGGGVVSGGRILEGCSNTSGELGHMTLVSRGRKCHCPNYGCLEAYVGGWAIGERAIEAVEENPSNGKNLVSIAGEVDNITASTLSKAYENGDPLARDIIQETGRFLGSGLVGIINAFNPCIVILGGGVIEGIPVLIDIAEKECREKALPPAVEKIKFLKAALREKAVAIGAAAMARELGRIK